MKISVSSDNALALTGSNQQVIRNTQQRNITKKIIGASIAALSFTAVASNSYSKGRAIKTDANNLRSAFPQNRDSKSGNSPRSLFGYGAGGETPQSREPQTIPQATFTVTLNNTQTGEAQLVSFDVAGFNLCTRRDQHRSIAISVYGEAGNSLEQLKTNQTLFAIKEGDAKVWQLSDYSLNSTEEVENIVGIRDSKRSEQTIDRGRLFGIGGADGLPRHRYAVSTNTPSGIADAFKATIKNSSQIQDAEKKCGNRQKAIISVSCIVGFTAVVVAHHMFKSHFYNN